MDFANDLAVHMIEIGVAHSHAIVAAQHGAAPESGTHGFVGNIFKFILYIKSICFCIDGKVLCDPQKVKVFHAEGGKGDGILFH